MSYQNIFKRYEIKYLITKEQKETIEQLMSGYMEADKYGRSTICNIYFDTPNYLLIRRSTDKPMYKEKLRVRSYGTADKESTIFVELKKKYDSVVYKRRIDMKEKTAMKFLCERRKKPKSQIGREIDYCFERYEGLQPKVFISYEREAFYSKTDKNFRITFDKKILWRDYDLSLCSGAYGSELLKKDEALCFSTGFFVNSGVLAVICGREDYIICDERDHASIVDGRRLSFAKQLKFKHNDMEDLEKQLQKCEPNAIKLIVVDGVFSMEGDLANLPEIVRLKKKYNASIMVDEAHGIGVFGDEGRGVCDYFGVTDDVDLIMGTFSKSLASIGGFIAADKDTINYLRHTCRTYIFSASNTPAATAAAKEALRIIRTEPERRERLWETTNYALKRFKEEGFEIGDTESPIIPLYVRDVDKTFIVTKLAFDNGVFINPVIPPACAPQDTLVRFALMATHTQEQVEKGVQVLKKIFVEQGIIK